MASTDDWFRWIVETIGVGVGVYGATGTYEYVNAAAAALLGTDTETLVGRGIWETNPGFDRDRFPDYWASFDVGETRIAETGLAFEGTTVDASVLTTCVERDGTRYHVGTIRDIGEQIERQAALEYQRSLLKAQQEATIDGILIVDEHDEILSYNHRFAEMWDVPERLIDERDDEPVLQHVVEQVREPEEFLARVQYLYAHRGEDSRDRIELRDGRVFDRYTTAVADDDTYFGRLWVFRDVTDDVERQRALERQNERLDEFASIVSHDLRNPLNVAEGRVELAADEYDSEHLTAAARALERMETLIQDVLTLARQGGSVDETEPVHLADVAGQAWQNVDTADATLQVTTDAVVVADESRLVQVFENLFRNAVEHGGETVTVTVGPLARGFAVEDDGPGIPVDAREAVMDVGYSTAEEGTGFGLSIVRDIVEAHGWAIAITSSRDGGARFEITGVDVVDEERSEAS